MRCMSVDNLKLYLLLLRNLHGTQIKRELLEIYKTQTFFLYLQKIFS